MLNTGKTYRRQDTDTSLGRDGSIFQSFKLQFNDPGLIVSKPESANALHSSHEIFVNDPNRVEISRDFAWLRDLYYKTLSDYRRAMQKWKKGTGGGSGAAENYADWNERSDEVFSKYGGVKGDMLAWIYMLDKDQDFPLL